MKTVTEWSLEFDLLYDNITSHKAPGLTPYEKSVFLTRAEESVVTGLYRGTFGDAFEATEEVLEYLSSLVRQGTGTKIQKAQDYVFKVSDKSSIYLLGEDVLFLTMEWCMIHGVPCSTEEQPVQVPVIPVTQDEYFRTVNNPFKKQNSKRVLRLAYGITSNDPVHEGSDSSVDGDDIYEQRFSELVSDYPIDSYNYRYLAKPEPIILQTLSGGLKINGKTDAQTCLLPESIHQTILAEAVRLAKAVWES